MRDAEQARQVIAEARRRMRDGEIDVLSSPGRPDWPAVPSEIQFAAGEDVLWTGRPTGIPWWFGRHDVCLAAFALAWLAFVAGMGVLAVQSENAAFLMFLVPFALASGVYPAAGRGSSPWRPLGGGTPVVVQAWLRALLPSVLHGTSIVTGLASADRSRQCNGWKELTWPATTVAPPAFIALADAQEVARLIGTAQIATRTPANK